MRFAHYLLLLFGAAALETVFFQDKQRKFPVMKFSPYELRSIDKTRAWGLALFGSHHSCYIHIEQLR